jgi:multiple antibiotic resistance protein
LHGIFGGWLLPVSVLATILWIVASLIGAQLNRAVRSHPEEGRVDVHFAITALATAFTIIDPLGMIPLTLAVTGNVPADVRARIVDRAVIAAAVILLVMGVIGHLILRALGITLPAFMIAGGILLLLIAIDMVFARRIGAKQSSEEAREDAEAENPAIFPLAIPMIAGPGAIASVFLLVSLAKGKWGSILVIAAAYAVVLVATWGCMHAASAVARRIGHTGINVVTRLFGIILAALAIQFILNGVVETHVFK